MSHSHLPLSTLVTIEEAIASRKSLVIVTYYEGQSPRSTLCTTKEEYLSANVTLFFDENINPSSIRVHGNVPEDWNS